MGGSPRLEEKAGSLGTAWQESASKGGGGALDYKKSPAGRITTSGNRGSKEKNTILIPRLPGGSHGRRWPRQEGPLAAEGVKEGLGGVVEDRVCLPGPPSVRGTARDWVTKGAGGGRGVRPNPLCSSGRGGGGLKGLRGPRHGVWRALRNDISTSAPFWALVDWAQYHAQPSRALKSRDAGGGHNGRRSWGLRRSLIQGNALGPPTTKSKKG